MELIKPSKLDVNVQENDGRTGRLIAEPLERGFGLTLGNAIRRVLLSSLQGAAITSVKIKGVVHEFSTIPGVKEDLTDILLNLKSIAIKVHSPGLKKIYIKANGSGEIRAGNFETDSETEIMNKDQLIMTLDANADVEIEANIETGNTGLTVGGSTPFSDDGSGALTLQNVDVLDATTEATIEAAIDTLSNLTSIGTISTGVWQGTPIGTAYGGTGLNAVGTSGKILVSNGSALAYQDIDGGTFT